MWSLEAGQLVQSVVVSALHVRLTAGSATAVPAGTGYYHLASVQDRNIVYALHWEPCRLNGQPRSLGPSLRIHPQQIGKIEFRAVGFTQRQSLIQTKLKGFNKFLEALRIVLLVQGFDVVVCRWLANADHIWRHMESRTDVFRRQLH